jgi:hypothetical protein
MPPRRSCCSSSARSWSPTPARGWSGWRGGGNRRPPEETLESRRRQSGRDPSHPAIWARIFSAAETVRAQFVVGGACPVRVAAALDGRAAAYGPTAHASWDFVIFERPLMCLRRASSYS